MMEITEKTTLLENLVYIFIKIKDKIIFIAYEHGAVQF